jgi:tRNA(His) 5'-end guanylyltransferase
MKEAIGNRMKEFYENRTRYLLPRRTYTLIRIDGKAFHTYTKGLNRPFDSALMNDMDETAKYLCKNIQGAKFAYVQSDEISILLTDFETLTTDAWFDGNIQKITSVSASLATAKFNELRFKDIQVSAMFDARVWTIPSNIEVENYFIWRQQDATRNSILSVAQTLYSHKEMSNKKCNELQEMIFQKGINWDHYSLGEKNGRLIIKETYLKGESNRTKWISIGAETFSQNREILENLIPKYI